MAILTLTDKQFEFLERYHEALAYGLNSVAFFGDYRVIDRIISLPEYQEIMNGMGWDDVLDRYTEHPNYNNTLCLTINKQLNKLKLP